MTPPAIITPALLATIRSYPHLPANTWYLITGATLTTLNRADELPKLFRHAIEKGAGPSDSAPSHVEQLQIARRTREALIKGAAIIGLPKTINALYALKDATPRALQDEPMAYSPSGRVIDIYTTPTSQILQRGQKFFDQVYGKVTKRVMGQMDRSGTEDLGLLARLEYGYILSPSNILTPAETSYCLLAYLIPQDVNPQLKGHLQGTVNNGATAEQVRAVRDVVIKICEAAGMRHLEEKTVEGWGWRQPVANLKTKL